MEVPGPDSDWRTPQFRQKIVAQIDDAMRKSGSAHNKSSSDMENHIYGKAKSREEYLSLVARLIIHFRDIQKKNLGGGPDPMNTLTNLPGVGGMGPRPTGAPVGGMGAMGPMQIGQHAMAGVTGNPQPRVDTKRKRNKLQRVCDVVNALGSEQRPHSGKKKKESAIKLDVKQRVAVQHGSVTKTGGGTVVDLTPSEDSVVAILGDTTLSGVVEAHEGELGHSQGESTDSSSVTTGPSVSSNTADPSVSTPSAEVRPCGCVLTQAVLDLQGEKLSEIRGINRRLDQLVDVLCDICETLKRNT